MKNKHKISPGELRVIKEKMKKATAKDKVQELYHKRLGKESRWGRGEVCVFIILKKRAATNSITYAFTKMNTSAVV